MSTKKDNSGISEQLQEVRDALAPYRDSHHNAQVRVEAQNSVSIRIRIIDPEFEGIDWVDREPEVWKLLRVLPEETFLNITMLLLLTPSEAATSLANLEFEKPIHSRL